MSSQPLPLRPDARDPRIPTQAGRAAADSGLLAWWRAVEPLTRPVHPESRAVLDARWAGLPEHVKTPNQLLGRSAVGCEGTHGVFPGAT